MLRFVKVTLFALALALSGCLVTARPTGHAHGAVYVGGQSHGTAAIGPRTW